MYMYVDSMSINLTNYPCSKKTLLYNSAISSKNINIILTYNNIMLLYIKYSERVFLHQRQEAQEQHNTNRNDVE